MINQISKRYLGEDTKNWHRRHHLDERVCGRFLHSKSGHEDPHRRIYFFGRKFIINKATKQLLNTTSSTEAELVGCSDFLPSEIYANLFLHEQGYTLKPATLHQNNKSNIKLLNNGRMSCGKIIDTLTSGIFSWKIESKEVNLKYLIVLRKLW